MCGEMARELVEVALRHAEQRALSRGADVSSTFAENNKALFVAGLDPSTKEVGESLLIELNILLFFSVS